MLLHGGPALHPATADLDRQALALTRGGRVVIVGYAAAPGPARQRLTTETSGWWVRLGARDLAVAGDERHDGPLLASAGLLVLTGADPARLLHALAPHAPVLRRSAAMGASAYGAGAAAEVLGDWMAMPGSGHLVPGLGLVENALVLARFGSGPDGLERISDPVPPDTLVFGLPERAGLLLDGTRATALGSGQVSAVDAHVRLLTAGQSIRF